MGDLFKNSFNFFVGMNIGVLLAWLYTLWKKKQHTTTQTQKEILNEKYLNELQSKLKDYHSKLTRLQAENNELLATVNKLPALSIEGKFVHRQLQDLRDNVKGMITCMQRMSEKEDAQLISFIQMLEKFSITVWKMLPTLKTKLQDEMTTPNANAVIEVITRGWEMCSTQHTSAMEHSNTEEIIKSIKEFYELILNVPAKY